MSKPQHDKDRHFDVRIVEAQIRRGTITADDYKAYLASLPDDAEHAEPSNVVFESAFRQRHADASES